MWYRSNTPCFRGFFKKLGKGNLKMLTIELNHDEIEALNKALTMLSEHTYENHLDQLDNVLASYEIDSDYHNHASKRAHDIYDNEKNIIDNLFKKITLVEKEIT